MLYNFEMQIHAKINLSQPFISEIMQMYFFIFEVSECVGIFEKFEALWSRLWSKYFFFRESYRVYETRITSYIW